MRVSRLISNVITTGVDYLFVPCEKNISYSKICHDQFQIRLDENWKTAGMASKWQSQKTTFEDI